MKSVIAIIAMLFSTQALAADQFTVRNPWVRAMPEVSKVTAGFFALHNAGDKPKYIVSVTSPQFGKVELHETKKEGDVMKMQQQESFLVPTKMHLVLKPGAKHLMMFDAKQPLKVGDKVTVVLMFKDGSEYSFEMPVKPMNEMPHKTHKHHHH